MWPMQPLPTLFDVQQQNIDFSSSIFYFGRQWQQLVHVVAGILSMLLYMYMYVKLDSNSVQKRITSKQ